MIGFDREYNDLMGNSFMLSKYSYHCLLSIVVFLRAVCTTVIVKNGCSAVYWILPCLVVGLD